MQPLSAADRGGGFAAWPGEIKTEGLRTSGSGAGFQVGDARGWPATRSAALGGDVRGDSDWPRVVIDYITLPDTKEIQIMARRQAPDDEGDEPVSGRAHYRLLKVQEFQPDNGGAVPDLSVNAAKRPDGTATLMIVNTNLDRHVPARILIRGQTAAGNSRADAWSLVGPTPWATNAGEKTRSAPGTNPGPSHRHRLAPYPAKALPDRSRASTVTRAFRAFARAGNRASMGNCRYPEQHRSCRSTARSGRSAFCYRLWRASWLRR